MGAHSADAFAIASCHHTSRPAFIGTSCFVRFTTTTCFTDGAPSQRLVDVRLERDDRAAAEAAVRGDDHARLGVVHPVAHRLGARSRRRRRCAWRPCARRPAWPPRPRAPSACRSPTRSPGLTPEALQHVREPADLDEQLAVGQRAGVARAPLPRSGRACPCGRPRRGGPGSSPTGSACRSGTTARAERSTRARGPTSCDHWSCCACSPQNPSGILDAAAVERPVLVQALDVRLALELGRRGEDPLLLQDREDVRCMQATSGGSVPSLKCLEHRERRGARIARREEAHIGNMQPTSNEASRDASALECRETSETGHCRPPTIPSARGREQRRASGAISRAPRSYSRCRGGASTGRRRASRRPRISRGRAACRPLR